MLKFIFIFILLVIFGCGDPVVIEDENDGTSNYKALPPSPITIPIEIPTNLTCPSGTNLNYDNFGEGFMLSYCTSCHNQSLAPPNRNDAPIDIDLDTPSSVQIWRTKILEVSTLDSGNTMPPGIIINDIDKYMLREWLNCGAPTGTDNVTGERSE